MKIVKKETGILKGQLPFFLMPASFGLYDFRKKSQC